jgi:type IV secretory pathway TraG/TraD family ATPase VirD4
MSFNAKDMTQGGQIASMRIRMFSQIANIMLYCQLIFTHKIREYLRLIWPAGLREQASPLQISG